MSIAEPDALQLVYAHGNGVTKSDFYDAFVSIRRGVFNTMDRKEHTRKRKLISHSFSAKAVVEFEPMIRTHVQALAKQWDRFCEVAKKGGSGPEGYGWEGRDGTVWFDCLPCEYTSICLFRSQLIGGPKGFAT